MTKTIFNRMHAKFTAVLAIGLAAGWAGLASAEVPAAVTNMIPAGLVNYQGTLLTPENVPYTNGIYEIEFRIYPASSGGTNTALWGAGYKVFVNNGVFGLMLGQSGGTVLNDNPDEFLPGELWKALWFDERTPANLDLYLGITVKQDQNRNDIASPAEAVPRQQFLATPYAARAQQAMYARRSSGDFNVGGNLTAPNITGALNVSGPLTAINGIVGNSANFSGTVYANSISGTTITGATFTGTAFTGTAFTGTTISGTTFTGSGANLTGVAKLAGGNSFSGSQTFDTNVVVRGNLQIGTNRYAAAGEENLRIVRGSVWVTNSNPNMAASFGSGWSVGNPNTGVYHLMFITPFSGIPTVTTTLWDSRPYVINVAQVTTSDCWVRIYSDNDNDLTELAFQFIAVGPR